MMNLCPQRGCPGIYNLTSADVGRTFTCTKCGTLLRFDNEGLKVANRRSTEPTATDAEDAPAPPFPPPIPEFVRMAPHPHEETALTLLFTWLFAFGAILVVVFLFLPVIDQFALVRESARIEAGDRKQARLDGKLLEGIRKKDGLINREDDKDKPGPRDPLDSERRERKSEKEDWEKKKKVMEEDLEESRSGARRAHYVYAWGMLAGFLLLAVSSVGFLSGGPTTARRVVGAVVLCAEVLLIFMLYLGFSVAARSGL
jgi:hypothetical protein